ncbi:PadR family transcriptional regulator [Streptomyces goshikiensis]|uniref:PadR family transcriptional regulator n=1 Tax=Streptomyces goshikiensis TaxID=1942 RepID=UPI0036525B41
MRIWDPVPGTVYPILDRLAERGWVKSWDETSPHPGRPARRYYELTDVGRLQATEALAAHREQRSRLGIDLAGGTASSVPTVSPRLSLAGNRNAASVSVSREADAFQGAVDDAGRVGSSWRPRNRRSNQARRPRRTGRPAARESGPLRGARFVVRWSPARPPACEGPGQSRPSGPADRVHGAFDRAASGSRRVCRENRRHDRSRLPQNHHPYS